MPKTNTRSSLCIYVTRQTHKIKSKLSDYIIFRLNLRLQIFSKFPFHRSSQSVRREAVRVGEERDQEVPRGVVPGTGLQQGAGQVQYSQQLWIRRRQRQL